MAKHASVCSTNQEIQNKHPSSDIVSSNSKIRKEFPVFVIAKPSLVENTTVAASVNSLVVDSGITDSSYLKNASFPSHWGIGDSECNLSFKGGFDDSKDVISLLDPKPFRFSTPIEAAISRSNSGCRMDPNRDSSSLKNFFQSESKSKVSSSYYFEAYGSISIESGRSINSTLSKSANDSCVRRGNRISSSTPSVKPSGNSCFTSNDWYTSKS